MSLESKTFRESESNWDSLLGTIKRLLVGSLLLVGVAVF